MAPEAWEQITSRIESEQEHHRKHADLQELASHKEYLRRHQNTRCSPEGNYWITIPELVTGWRVEPLNLKILYLGDRYGLSVDFGSIQGTGYSDLIEPHQTSCELKFYVFGKKLLDDGRWTKIPGVWNGNHTFQSSSFTDLYGWLALDSTTICFHGLKTSDGRRDPANELQAAQTTSNATSFDKHVALAETLRTPQEEPFRLTSLPGELRSMIANFCDESSFKGLRATCRTLANEMPSTAWFKLNWLEDLWWPSMGFHPRNGPLSVKHRAFCPQHARTVANLSINFGPVGWITKEVPRFSVFSIDDSSTDALITWDVLLDCFPSLKRVHFEPYCGPGSTTILQRLVSSCPRQVVVVPLPQFDWRVKKRGLKLMPMEMQAWKTLLVDTSKKQDELRVRSRESWKLKHASYVNTSLHKADFQTNGSGRSKSPAGTYLLESEDFMKGWNVEQPVLKIIDDGSRYECTSDLGTMKGRGFVWHHGVRNGRRLEDVSSLRNFEWHDQSSLRDAGLFFGPFVRVNGCGIHFCDDLFLEFDGWFHSLGSSGSDVVNFRGFKVSDDLANC